MRIKVYILTSGDSSASYPTLSELVRENPQMAIKPGENTYHKVRRVLQLTNPATYGSYTVTVTTMELKSRRIVKL
jgi:hypothetical protein